MEIILCVFLSILLATSIYVNINLYRKINVFEKFFTRFAEILIIVERGLNEIDIRGSFSSDDEIGFAFRRINDLWKLLFSMGLQTRETIEKQKPPTYDLTNREKNIQSISNK